MKFPRPFSEIDAFFNRAEFVEKTIQQINKDLLGLGGELKFIDHLSEPPLNYFSQKLAELLKDLKAAQLQQFVYRVDLKQSDFEMALRKEDDFQTLAYFVLRREAQKVYLRAFYR